MFIENTVEWVQSCVNPITNNCLQLDLILSVMVYTSYLLSKDDIKRREFSNPHQINLVYTVGKKEIRFLNYSIDLFLNKIKLQTHQHFATHK